MASIQKIDGFNGDVIPGEPVYGDLVRITYDNGTVQEKYYRPAVAPAEPLRVYVHVLVTGPTANNLVSIPANGTTAATISFMLRESADPASQVLDINRTWAFPLRDSDKVIHDYLGIRYVAGTAVIEYTSTKPGLITLEARDVNDVIGNAIVTLATAPKFLVYTNYV